MFSRKKTPSQTNFVIKKLQTIGNRKLSDKSIFCQSYVVDSYTLRSSYIFEFCKHTTRKLNIQLSIVFSAWGHTFLQLLNFPRHFTAEKNCIVVIFYNAPDKINAFIRKLWCVGVNRPPPKVEVYCIYNTTEIWKKEKRLASFYSIFSVFLSDFCTYRQVPHLKSLCS